MKRVVAVLLSLFFAVAVVAGPAGATITTDYTPLSYAGNDTATSFAVSWPFVSGTTDLSVTFVATDGITTAMVYGTDYTTTGGAGTTGTVVYPVSGNPLATGEALRIERAMDLTQPTGFSAGGRFDPEDIEDALDRLELQIQEVDEATGRAAKFPNPYGSFAGVDGPDLPAPSDGAWLRWDGTDFENFTPDDTLTGVANVQSWVEGCGDGTAEQVKGDRYLNTAVADHGSVATTGSLAYVLADVAADEFARIRLCGDTTFVVSTAITVTDNVDLDFSPGAVLQPASGIAIVFSAGHISAGPFQIFDLSLSGTVDIDALENEIVYDEWWGAGGGTGDYSAALNNVSADFGYNRLDTNSIDRTVRTRLTDVLMATDYALNDGTGDQSAALNYAAAYCLANGLSMHMPAGTYRCTSPLAIKQIVVTADGWNKTIIDKAHDGVGINVLEGGSTFTELYDFSVISDGTDAAVTSHGVKVLDSRVKLRLWTTAHAGDGLNVECDDGNNNHSEIKLHSAQNAVNGAYFTGAGADANLFKLAVRTFSNDGDGVKIDVDGNHWEGWVTGEDNTGTNLNIEAGGDIDLFAYLESGGAGDYSISAGVTNVSLTGRLGTGVDLGTLTSLSLGGLDQLVRGTAGKVTRKVAANQMTISASNYMDEEFYGSGGRLLVTDRTRADGVRQIKAYAANGTVADAELAVFGDEKKVAVYVAGGQEAFRVDSSTTSGDTPIMIAELGWSAQDTFVDGDVSIDADGTDDHVTLTGHGITDDTRVQLTTTGTLPAGLALTTDYYTFAVDVDTVSLHSATPAAAGNIVQITAAAGTGTHTVNVLSGSIVRVTVGASDSGGAGYKLLRIPN